MRRSNLDMMQGTLDLVMDQDGFGDECEGHCGV